MFFVCKMVADVWLPRLKHLRVLSFSYPTLTGLPDKSFDKLIHLRYLDLSHTCVCFLSLILHSLVYLISLLTPFLPHWCFPPFFYSQLRERERHTHTHYINFKYTLISHQVPFFFKRISTYSVRF